MCASSSRVQAAAADAGPPTRSPGCTDLTARADTSYSRKYSCWVPDQNTSRFGSFHTSNAQRPVTSSAPYRWTRWLARAAQRSPQRSQSAGGEMTAW